MAKRGRRSVGFALLASVLICTSGCAQTLEPDARRDAFGEAMATEDWPAAFALVESAPWSRAEKNAVRAAIYHRRGQRFLERERWNDARLDFIEARRITGNPEFIYDEAVAYRGFGNRKIERILYKQYLGHCPEGPHADDARKRLRVIAPKTIKRPRHGEEDETNAALERPAFGRADKPKPDGAL